MSVFKFSVLIGFMSFVKVWFKILYGMIVRKTSHVNTRMKNQGAGFNCGMSLEVVGSHQFLA